MGSRTPTPGDASVSHVVTCEVRGQRVVFWAMFKCFVVFLFDFKSGFTFLLLIFSLFLS